MCNELDLFLQSKAFNSGMSSSHLGQSEFKTLFCQLLYCSIESDSEKQKSGFMKHAKHLIKSIILNIEDQIGFVTELLESFVFREDTSLSKNQQE